MNERIYLHHRVVMLALAAAIPVALALGFLLGVEFHSAGQHVSVIKSAVRPI